jgi:hypothetical protein
MEPKYVTYEQAKWLKEKWVNHITPFMYGSQVVPQLEKYNETKYNIYQDYCLAPEQHQVVEWLRVNHGIWVSVTQELGATITYCYLISGEHTSSTYKAFFDTPQEAYSAAFDYIKDKELI